MDAYSLDFVMYLTGHKKETIDQLHEQWLKIKNSPDFEEFHPELSKELKNIDFGWMIDNIGT